MGAARAAARGDDANMRGEQGGASERVGDV